jgi:nucleoside-diphosphate-sugar epimerase
VKRILVTGHRGYIGTVLVPMLLARGHEIVGSDIDIFAECTYALDLPAVPDLGKDIRDIGSADLRGFDAVVHLAGLSNDPLGNYRTELTDEINHRAAAALATAARKAGVRRFVFASSCSNYGAAGSDFLTEQAAFNPVTPYGRSKIDAERAIARLADESFCPTYLRASTVYGMSPRIRFDLVLNNLIAWAYTTGVVYLKSDGTAWRPVVHVEDVARAFVAVLEAPAEAVWNEAFNVGQTTENYQVRELAEIVREVVPGCHIEYAADASADRRSYRVDCDKIATRLHGFKPQWTARRGADELYRAFREHGLAQGEFEGPRYSRVAHIMSLVRNGKLGEDLRRRSQHDPVQGAASA